MTLVKENTTIFLKIRILKLGERSDEQVVMISDIFDIIKFIHHTAINMLLNDATMLQKHMCIIEKADLCKHWILTRHHLFYIWLFYGFRTLPTLYPSYDPSGNNKIANLTRWVSKTMKMEAFFNEYRHYYINEIPHHKSGYYLYKTPPTHEENWYWAADPSNF